MYILNNYDVRMNKFQLNSPPFEIKKLNFNWTDVQPVYPLNICPIDLVDILRINIAVRKYKNNNRLLLLNNSYV